MSNSSMNDPTIKSAGRSELTKRVLSGVVMATVSIVVAILGSWPFAIVWLGASLAVAYEWQRLVHKDNVLIPALLTAVAVISAVAGAFWLLPMLFALAVLAIAVSGVLAPTGAKISTTVGAVYAAGFGASILLCRGEAYFGLIVVMWLFAVVWGTDILAYFTGRSLGGPKLWPSVSPKKTWSGAVGGLVGGTILGCVLLFALGITPKVPHVLLSIVFSVLTQSGDLFESAIKRRYNVKDSGSLIPGHGGFMDRLDGFIFAAIFAALFGVMRGGLAGVPSGLVNWS